METINHGLSILNSSWQYFLDSGYKILYHHIFGTLQYPFWTTVQALWCLQMVKRSMINVKKNVKYFLISFIISFFLTFAHRELLAIFLNQPSPIMQNFAIVTVFIVLYYLVLWFPFDLFGKLINFPLTSYFIGFFHGMNQMRLFTLILRRVSLQNNTIVFVLAFLFSTWEESIFQIFRFSLRFFVDIQNVPSASILFFYRTALFDGIFWVLTHQTPISPQIGHYEVHFPSIIISILQGTCNAAEIVQF